MQKGNRVEGLKEYDRAEQIFLIIGFRVLIHIKLVISALPSSFYSYLNSKIIVPFHQIHRYTPLLVLSKVNFFSPYFVDSSD